MGNIKNRNCIHPNSPHNNSEHENTDEDDRAVEDDDNDDREQTVGWPKRVQTLERCLCELFEFWARRCLAATQTKTKKTQRFELAVPRKNL